MSYLAIAKNKVDYYLNQTEWVNTWDNVIYKRIPRTHIDSVPPYDKRDGSYVFGKNWTRIINARHPFDRLYSGWSDKFNLTIYGEDAEFIKYKEAIDVFELQASKVIDVNGGTGKKVYTEEHEYDYNRFTKPEDVTNMELWIRPKKMVTTFIAFLHYIANTEFKYIDPHFLPTSMICQPCATDFSWISQQETLSEDIVHSFNKVFNDDTKYCGKGKEQGGCFLNKRDRILSSHMLRNRQNLEVLSWKSQKSDKIKFLYAKIYEENSTLISKLFEKFKWDFNLFGYDLSGYINM